MTSAAEQPTERQVQQDNPVVFKRTPDVGMAGERLYLFIFILVCLTSPHGAIPRTQMDHRIN